MYVYIYNHIYIYTYSTSIYVIYTYEYNVACVGMQGEDDHLKVLSHLFRDFLLGHVAYHVGFHFFDESRGSL